MADKTEPKAAPSAADVAKRQRGRSLAIAGLLVFLAFLFYLITIFKMGGGVLSRSI